jgi:hypothetical protein
VATPIQPVRRIWELQLSVGHDIRHIHVNGRKGHNRGHTKSSERTLQRATADDPRFLFLKNGIVRHAPTCVDTLGEPCRRKGVSGGVLAAHRGLPKASTIFDDVVQFDPRARSGEPGDSEPTVTLSILPWYPPPHMARQRRHRVRPVFVDHHPRMGFLSVVCTPRTGCSTAPRQNPRRRSTRTRQPTFRRSAPGSPIRFTQ